MTDFRACGTIMGLAGLTAVFGMGTGGAPPVSSPEVGRGGFNPLDRGGVLPVREVGHTSQLAASSRRHGDHSSGAWPSTGRGVVARLIDGIFGLRPGPAARWGTAADRGGQAARLLGPVGCDGRPSCTPGLSTWSSSRSLQTHWVMETSS